MTQEEGKEPSGDVRNNEFEHSKGRPTLQEQIKIESELRPYFEGGYNATFTSNQTGYDIKTVLSYFNKWKKELVDSENEDFLKRVREQKERTIINLDSLIHGLEEFKKEIETIIKAAIKVGNFEVVEKFSKLKLKTIENIGKFISAKTNLVNTPTIDVLIELEKMGEKKNGF
jgi:hypothetical protein